MKQTAIQFVVNELEKLTGLNLKDEPIIEKALEMEKEQMHKCASFWRGKENAIERPIFEQYYNETFKSE